MSDLSTTHSPVLSHNYLVLFEAKKTPIHSSTTFALYADAFMTAPIMSENAKQLLQGYDDSSKASIYSTWLRLLAGTSWLLVAAGFITSFFESSAVIGILFPVGFIGVWITAKLAPS